MIIKCVNLQSTQVLRLGILVITMLLTGFSEHIVRNGPLQMTLG